MSTSYMRRCSVCASRARRHRHGCVPTFRPLTRKDSEGGLWLSDSYGETPNNLIMSKLVSMAKDHFINLDSSPGVWGKLSYKRAKGYKA